MSISVVIPAWNAAATLGETLASVAGQARPADEVIVVDDGSSDATALVARRAGGNVRVIEQARAGPAAALNRGIAGCSSTWLAFVDADDLWPEGKLALQLACCEREPSLDGVLGRMESFVCPSLDAATARRYPVPKRPQIAWSTGALLVRRESFARVGPFAEDLALGFAIDWFDRARVAGLMLAIPEPTVLLRRLRPGSLSHRDPHKDRAYLEMARRALSRRRATGSAVPPGGG